MSYNSKYTGKQVEDLLGKIEDLENQPSITEQDITDMGFTKNKGTITQIKMNGVVKGTDDIVDLGTVITAHQDISNKLDSTTAASTYATKTALQQLQVQLNTIVDGDASAAIESFNEIIAFLANIEDTETLEGVIAGINTHISSKADKSQTITDISRNGTTFTATRADGSAFTFTQQDSDTTYSNKTAVSGGTEESLVTTGEKYIWNTKGTYSKPSTGIPKIDLADDVQTSINKADTALQTIPSEYITETELASKKYTTEAYVTSAIANAKLEGSDIVIPVEDVMVNGTSVIVDRIAQIDLSNYANKTDLDSKQNIISDLTTIKQGAALGATALQSVPSEYVTETELVNKGYATTLALNTKVDKVNGKQLSTEDFTTVLKTKLEGLNNYDDTELSNAIETLRGDFDTIVSGDTTTAIKTFNEVIAFLDGIKDNQDLSSIIASIEQQIASKMDKVTLASVATSGSYNDLKNKPTIPSAVTESTISGWGFTKNTGTYSKPSTGIPKSDLASIVQTSLGRADTALQSYTETDPIFSASVAAGIKYSDISNWNSKTSNIGTITGIKMNGVSKGVSGVVDLGTVITSHQDISGKLDATTAASTYATKTEVSTAKSEANNYTDTKIANLINGAPTTLDTLDEIAAALKDNADIVDVLNQSIGSKQDTISDLETIRIGAAKGATALQSYTEKYTGTYSKPSTGIPKYDLSADVTESLDKANNAASKTELNDALSLKVDKQNGKKLTTEDFTSALKTKLESLNNYDDTSINNAFETLRNDFNTLINGDTSSSINSFNKIVKFLNGVDVSKSLNGIVTTIEQQIENTNKNIPTKTSQLANDSGYLNSAIAVLNIVYPVGSIYISIDPKNLFDIFGFGTWELIKDRFLLGAGDIYQAGSTGGEATHTLTISEMPSHTHSSAVVSSKEGSQWLAGAQRVYSSWWDIEWMNDRVGGNGGDQPHNNMPPYLAVYIWKRVS